MLCYVVAHVCVNVGQAGLKFLVHAKTNGFSCCSRIVIGRCSKGRVQCMFRHCQLKSKTAVFPSVKGADLIPLADVVTSPSCQLSSRLAKFMVFLLMGKKYLLISERMGWMKVKESAEAFDQAFAHAKEAAAENVSTSSVSLFPSA